MTCKVSVIIPVYNAEGTIRRCVESLVYGKYKDRKRNSKKNWSSAVICSTGLTIPHSSPQIVI